NPKLAGYAYDPQKARDLLAQAGYPGGRGLPPFAIWSSVKRNDVVLEHEQIKKSLAAVGITAEIHYHTHWAAVSTMVEGGKLPTSLWAGYPDVPAPDNSLTNLSDTRSSRNFVGYSNPAVDDLLISARASGDAHRRVELYRRAEQLILDDAPLIPVFHHM